MTRLLPAILLSITITACATDPSKETQEAIADGVSTFLLGFIK